MPTPVYAAENTGARIYRIGRVGFDSGLQDAGGIYTATLRTDKFTPAGEDGLVQFRRVAIRIWHTGAYELVMRVYVDGVQTSYYVTNTVTAQQVTFTRSAPTSSPAEQVEEADIEKIGTSIEIELVLNSDDVTGIFLPETIEIHGRVIRQSKSRTAETT